MKRLQLLLLLMLVGLAGFAQDTTSTNSANINYFIVKTLILATDFNYIINTGRAEGYNQAIPLWNASLAKQIFKKNNGDLIS